MPHIIGQGQPPDKKWLPLATRTGRKIRNEQRFERPPDARREGVRRIKEQWPNAELRSCTAVYDCMGMVFASRRTWVDLDQVSSILSDDGYREIMAPEKPQAGDLVLYGSGGSVCHVGLVDRVTEFETYSVLSKWGADGEYRHAIEDVPSIYGKPVGFWTDRKASP